MTEPSSSRFLAAALSQPGLGLVAGWVVAAMILGGMGPVDVMHTSAGKIFASCYALFSGVFFIGITSIVMAPVAHRLLHSLHVDVAE